MHRAVTPDLRELRPEQEAGSPDLLTRLATHSSEQAVVVIGGHTPGGLCSARPTHLL